jgi:arsenate reductase
MIESNPLRCFPLAMTIYIYDGCSTCRSALQWLRSHGIEFKVKAIRESPPSLEELNLMLSAMARDDRLLFNSNGQDYRSMDLKKKLPQMSLGERLLLLASNGHLVKRPFLIDAQKGIYLLGFKESRWLELLCRMK